MSETDTKAQVKMGTTPDDYFDGNPREYPLLSRIFFTVVVSLVWAFSKIYWRWTIEGPNPFKDRPEQAKGRVIVSNHASMFDPVALISLAKVNGCYLRGLYKSELNESGLAAWFFSRVGAIPIKRGSADLKAIKRAVKTIKDGNDICIFPEGTRIKDPQARPELHGGFALIASMADCEIIPVAIDGSEKIVPEGKHFPRPVKVRVRFGEPFTLDDVEGATRKEKSAAAETYTMERVYAMRDELRAH